MDISLIVSMIIIVVSLFVFHEFFSADSYDFFKNLLPEVIGIAFTYLIIDNLISRRKRREDERRLTNLYHQIRRELFNIIQNLRQMSNYIEHEHDRFYNWTRDNKNSSKIIYPLLIAGNDLFSEYFYATLFRVIRDVEKMMDHIQETYPNIETNPALMILGDKNHIQHLHNELANFIMTCEYDDDPESIELIGESGN